MSENTEKKSGHETSDIRQSQEPGEIAPSQETSSQIITQDSTTMEVHHHAHHNHGKRNWKSYFWEFFMLFLAVFCGSLAELQVEHYIEHQREEKYIHSLSEDLASDTADGDNDLADWTKILNQVDTLRAEIEKGQTNINYEMFYRLAYELTYNNTYSYHDRTISQLKNGGNFRLIREKHLADTLIEYDASIVYGLKDVEQFYTNNIFPQLRILRDQFLSSQFYPLLKNRDSFLAAVKHDPELIKFKKGKEDIVFQYYNTLYELRENTLLRTKILRRLKRQARNMLLQIKEIYKSPNH